MAEVVTVVPARQGRAVFIPQGVLFDIVDPNGGQVADTWAFSSADMSEHQSAEHTRVAVGKLFPNVGEDFVTNRRRPILRLEADTSPGIHDLLIAACDPSRYEQLGVSGWHASCQENLTTALAQVGFARTCVPQPINVFMNTPVLPDGEVRWLPTETQPGDKLSLRALMDVWLVVSACPQDITGINRTPGPMHIVTHPDEHRN
jgi:uncharacterized protein YcgI (DUF1989 family)